MKNVKPIGRFSTDVNDNFLHFWSGSGIEFETYSSSLIADIFCEYNTYEIWVAIELNGEQLLRTMLLPGNNKIPVYKNLNSDDKKHIRIIKDSQLDLDATSHFMCITNLTNFEGNKCDVFLPSKREFSIEFIGDSLTTGEGLRGSKNDLDYSYCYMSSSGTYAKLTADYFDADYSIISQCGFGVCAGWNNDPKMNIPNVYDYIDGKTQEYDFKTNFDFVVINLGTNDNGAFNMEPFSNGNTTYKITEEDLILKGKHFLNYCLIKNPKSHIIWMVGMCDISITKAIKEIVNSSAEPNRVTFLKVPSGNDIDLGSRQHPGPKTHKEAARHLINKINEIIQ